MKRLMSLTTLLSTGLLVSAIHAAEPLTLDDDTARINYSLGYQIGGDFKRQGVEMNAAAIIKGIEDALSGTEPMLPRNEMHASLMELKRKVVAEEQTRLHKNRRERELEYLAEGKQFMKENAARPEVKTTASGLQYSILQPGTGKAPKPTDAVTVNYRGTLTNGNEFDSSYARGEPSTFRLDNVIKGWTEGLQLVREGGKIQLVVPPELAYNKRGPLAHRTLIFDVELISVGDASPQAEASGTKTPAGDRQP